MFLVETATEGSPTLDVGFGCGDRLIPLTVPAAGTELEAAVHALLQQPDTLGLVTALHPNKLVLDSATVVSREAHLYFSGSLSLGGVCDHPRVVEQLNATARAAVAVDSVAVFVNGQPLSEFLSLRG
ncbi:MAG TPA: GerMN domain-containing protein [Rhodothermales bacterium]